MVSKQRIEIRLAQAERRARLSRLLTASAYLGAGVAGGVLVVGLFAVMGWVAAMWLAGMIYGGIAVVAVAIWAVLLLVTLLAPLARPQAAAVVEREQPALLDRLNTLVFLESRGDTHSPMATAIAQQASQVLAQPAPRAARRRLLGLRPLGALAASLLITLLFYRSFDPLERIRAAEAAAAARAGERPTAGLDIPPDHAALPEDPRDQPWAEIRIREPGRDLRATRWDLVPVEIEVAASEPLAPARWTLERLGQPAESRALAEPSDPAYALYEEELDLAQLAAEDWDVFAYQAESATLSGKQLRSDVYFIEVFPLQESLEQLPGGDEGLAFQWLDELSTLVARQQNVARQQARSSQLADPEEARLMRRLLAREAATLAVEHERLTTRMGSRLGPGSAAQQLRSELQSASEALQAASQSLQQDGRPLQGDESLRALEALAAARKAVQRAISEQPELFRDEAMQRIAEQASPADWRHWLRAAESLRKLAERQRELAGQDDADPAASPEARGALAAEQQQLLDELASLASETPELDEAEPAAWQKARDQLTAAAEALRQGESEAREKMAAAAEQLEQLAQPLETVAESLDDRAMDPLAAALEQQIQELERIAEQPAVPAPAERKAAADKTQQLADQLSELADRSPAERPELNKQLDTEAREKLNAACDKLGSATDAQAARSAAGAAAEQLEKAASALAADQTRQLADDVARETQQLQQQRQMQDQAREWVKNALREQRSLQREATPNRAQQFPELADRQERLQNEFQKFQENFAETLKPCQGACQSAAEEMGRSASALRSGQPAAQQEAEAAAQSLQELDSLLQQQQQGQHFAEAEQLGRLGERAGRELGAAAERPQRYGPPQRDQLGKASQTLVDHIRQFAAREDVQQQFGAEGAPAPSEQQRQQLAADAERLARSTDRDQQQGAAERMQRSMQQAGARLRSNTASPRGHSPGLRNEGQQAVERGLRQLRSLARRQQLGRPLGPDASQQLRQDAAQQLVEGLTGEYGHNEAATPLLTRLQRDLQEPLQPVDLQMVERLVGEIQSQRLEAAPRPDPDQPEAAITNIDSAKLPPAYREAIEQYFETLSEEP